MKRPFIHLLIACFSSGATAGAPALAPPGQIIAHSAAASETYLGSPSIAILPNGRYVASYDTFGPKADEDSVSVFASDDRGNTWQRLGGVSSQYWSTLFVLRGTLYLMGTDRSMGTPVIRRSDDGGTTWSTPKDSATGRFLYSGRYVTGPVPVVIDSGRVWRAFEVLEQGDLRARVLSAPIDGDLLDTSVWTATAPLASDKNWLGGNFQSWEEGNVVATVHGAPALLLRVNTRTGPEKAALVAVCANGRSLCFNPANDFVDFPGGGKKFTVRFDALSKRYWSITNAVPHPHASDNLERVRNTLALTSSSDLRHWRVERVLLQHPDQARHGFQYVDWQIDRNDIVAVVRMAFDDNQGGAHNQHDSNYVSFFRIRNFRETATNPGE